MKYFSKLGKKTKLSLMLMYLKLSVADLGLDFSY